MGVIGLIMIGFRGNNPLNHHGIAFTCASLFVLVKEAIVHLIYDFFDVGVTSPVLYRMKL